jgi:hypothetical protein
MKKALLIFGGLSLLGFGLYRYFKKQSEKLLDFKWDISSIKLLESSYNRITLQVNFIFTSESEIEAEIKKIYLDAFVQDKRVGSITETKPFIIPAKGSSNVPLIISLDLSSLLSNVVDIVLQTIKEKDIDIKLVGNAEIKSGFVNTVVPIGYDSTIKKIKKQMELDVQKKLAQLKK